MRRASLLTLFLIVFVDLMGFGILLPNQQYYGQMFGLADIWLVLIGPSYSLFQFLFAPVLGRWSDHVGRRQVLLISQAGTLAGFAILYLAHFFTGQQAWLGITLLYVSRVIDGISGGNIAIAAAYAADITTPENRAKGMGVIGAAFGIGFIFGPLIGGLVGGSKHLGLTYVPVAAAVFSLAAMILTWTSLPETVVPGAKAVVGSAARRFSFDSMLRALGRPIIGFLILTGFINGFAFAGMEQTLSLLIQRRVGLTKEAASWYTGLLFAGIGIVIAFIQGGAIRRLVKRFGEVPLVIVGPILTALGLAIIGIDAPESWPWAPFVAGGFFMAVGSSLFNPSVQALVSRHSNLSEQGEILGVHQGMASLARAVGPMLAGVLYQFVSPSSPYYVSAAICLAVGLMAFGQRVKITPPVYDTR